MKGEAVDIPVLRTARLVLTLPTKEDAEELLAYARRNFEAHAPWSPPAPAGWNTLENAHARITKMHTLFEVGTTYSFWFRKVGEPGGPFVGAANLNQVFLGPRRAAFLGYHLDHAHEGQGLMHEALAELVRHAFETLRLHRLEANHLPENKKSAAVLRRLGFSVEGYARDYLFIDGKFRDHVLNALVNEHLTDALALCTPPG